MSRAPTLSNYFEYNNMPCTMYCYSTNCFEILFYFFPKHENKKELRNGNDLRVHKLMNR